VVRAFKGRTARVLRQEFPYLRRFAKVLWSPSYFAASVGYVSEATVRRILLSRREGRWTTIADAAGAPLGLSRFSASSSALS